MNQPAISSASAPALSAAAVSSTSTTRRAPWILLGVFLLWGLTLLRATFANGDAAAYAEAALRGTTGPYAIHTGYLLAAQVWLKLTGLFMPAVISMWPGVKLLHGVLPSSLTTALSLNLLSLVWGGLAVMALLRLERRYLPGRLPGIAVACWLGMPGVLAALTTAEVEAMTWALSLWSLVLWLEGRSLGAPAVWGLAMTVTPAAVAMAPAFPLRPEPPRRELVGLFLIPLLMWGMLALLSGDVILHGPRGLLTSPPRVPLREMLEFRLGQLPSALGVSPFFALLGLLAAFRGDWPEGSRLIRALLFTTLQTFLMTDRYRDIPAYGFVGALLALVAAQGWHMTLEQVRGRLMGGVFVAGVGGALLLQLVLSDQSVRKVRRDDRLLACKSVALADVSRLDDAFRVYGPFRERRLFTWYTGRVIGDEQAGLASDGLAQDEGWYLGMPAILPFRRGWELVPIQLEDPDEPITVWRWRRTVEPDPFMAD